MRPSSVRRRGLEKEALRETVPLELSEKRLIPKVPGVLTCVVAIKTRIRRLGYCGKVDAKGGGVRGLVVDYDRFSCGIVGIEEHKIGAI